MVWRAFLLTVPLLGCGPSTTPRDESTPPVPVTGDESRQENVEVEQPSSARALGPTATFADMVAAARRLEDRGAEASDAGCLLRGSAASSWRLEADLAAAVKPLPEPPPSLGTLLEDHYGPIRVLSRWGEHGGGNLALSAFSSDPPPPQGILTVLFISEAGIYVRTTTGNVTEGPLPQAEALTNIPQSTRIYVTADAGLSLTRLRELLGALSPDQQERVVLAVALAAGTELPSPPAVGNSDAGLCPEGLPPLESGAAEGELGSAQILDALEPATSTARECMSHASPEAAVGGRMEIAFRIDDSGSVTQACALSDELRDSGLRTCVLDGFRALRFPAPNPAGSVDVALPLVLAPDRSSRQRALCH